MKQCSRCKEWKDESEFSKNKTKKDGLSSWCKLCFSKHQRTRDRTEVLKRYNSSEKGKQCRRKYSETDKGKDATAKYRDSEKYRATSRQYRVYYRKHNPEKAHAHDAITDAIDVGKLPPASSLRCVICKNQAAHYHHPDYSRPHYVIPVCPQCHTDIHKEMNQ